MLVASYWRFQGISSPLLTVNGPLGPFASQKTVLQISFVALDFQLAQRRPGSKIVFVFLVNICLVMAFVKRRGETTHHKVASDCLNRRITMKVIKSKFLSFVKRNWCSFSS